MVMDTVKRWLEKLLKDIPRDKIQISTKFGVIGKYPLTEDAQFLRGFELDREALGTERSVNKESIIKECEESLKRLKTDYVDLYSLHWPDPTIPNEEAMEAFEILFHQGKIRAAGICNHNKLQMEELDKLFSISSNKVRYSMLNRKIESDLIPFCIENQKTILAYSVLQRGILQGLDVVHIWTNGDNPKEVALYKRDNLKKINRFLDKITPIATDNGATLDQLGIYWAMEQLGISIILLGAKRPKSCRTRCAIC